MLCETWSSGGPGRGEALLRLFAEGLRVSALDSGAVRSRGRDLVRAAAAASGPAGWPSEPELSVFMEAAGGGPPGGPTLVLHVYEAGRAPGFEPGGMTGEPHDGPVAALLRVQDGAVDHVWLSGSGPAGRSRAGLREWALWGRVEEAARESVGGGRMAYYANDYGETEDRLGLGLATTSRSETWED
jgi:hypothetical protein